MSASKLKLYVTMWRGECVEVTPTGNWQIINFDEKSTLYLEVAFCSVQSQHQIEPFLAHEMDLHIKETYNNRCTKEVQDEQL